MADMIAFDEALLAQAGPAGAPILLALSGGADSSAALICLADFCRREGRLLAAVHLDHAIRADSAADAAFCADLCARFALPFYSRRVDVPALAAASGVGLEAAARDARYAYFAEVMAEAGISVLVTAHHADDNLETMLMRLTRGTGLRGLCGIPPMRPFGGGVLVRPFLRTAKADMEALCAAYGIRPRTDVTNADPAYTRNRIRAEVVPTLCALNPALLTRAADTADALRADEAYLADAARQRYADLPAPDRADADWLGAQPTAMRWRLFALLYGHLADTMLEQVHLRALDRLLTAGSGSLSLPDGICATLWGGELCFARNAPSSTALTPTPAATGWQTFDACRARTALLRGGAEENIVESDTNIYKLFINRNLNFDTIKGYLYRRTREPGDVLLLRGCHRKVKKLMQESRIPPADRDRLPILCDEEGIVFLPGVGLRDGVDGGDTAVIVLLER